MSQIHLLFILKKQLWNFADEYQNSINLKSNYLNNLSSRSNLRVTHSKPRYADPAVAGIPRKGDLSKPLRAETPAELKEYNKRKLTFSETNSSFNKPEKIFFGISGGQDSFCLRILLYVFKTQWDWQLTFFFCNHLWQVNSFYTQSHINNYLNILKLNFVFFTTVSPLVSEQNSRVWRFSIATRLITASNGTQVLTAHTLTDQTETILFNLIRGCGFKGLTSLPFKRVLVNKKYRYVFPKESLIGKKVYVRYISTKTKVHATDIDRKLFFGEILQSFLRFERRPYRPFATIEPFRSSELGWDYQKGISYSLWRDSPKVSKYSLRGFRSFVIGPEQRCVFPTIARQKSYFLVKTSLAKGLLPPLRGSKNKPKVFGFCLPSNHWAYCLTKNFTKKVSLSRPLLKVQRFFIKQFVYQGDLPIFPDKTNNFLHYKRNRLRKQLIPTIRLLLNPQIDLSLSFFANNIRMEKEIINYLQKRFFLSLSDRALEAQRQLAKPSPEGAGAVWNEKIFDTSTGLFYPTHPPQGRRQLYCQSYDFFRKVNPLATTKTLAELKLWGFSKEERLLEKICREFFF